MKLYWLDSPKTIADEAKPMKQTVEAAGALHSGRARPFGAITTWRLQRRKRRLLTECYCPRGASWTFADKAMRAHGKKRHVAQCSNGRAPGVTECCGGIYQRGLEHECRWFVRQVRHGNL